MAELSTVVIEFIGEVGGTLLRGSEAVRASELQQSCTLEGCGECGAESDNSLDVLCV